MLSPPPPLYRCQARAVTTCVLLPHASSTRRRLAVANAAGAVELHTLTQALTAVQAGENESFKYFLDSLVHEGQ